MDQEKIGNLIKKIRKENHLTQAELANKLGVTYQAVSKWETGKNIPDIAILKQISEEYNINIDDILNGEHNIQKKPKINKVIPLAILITLILTGVIVLLINKDRNLFIKRLITYDTNFEITGTVAKSNGKTYIYISDIEYKNEENKEVFDTIKASLYEEYKGKSTLIKECEKEEENVTIKEHLSKVTFNIDDYKSDCDDLTKAKLYLEIETTKAGEKVYFKIPLVLEDMCPEK